MESGGEASIIISSPWFPNCQLILRSCHFLYSTHWAKVTYKWIRYHLERFISDMKRWLGGFLYLLKYFAPRHTSLWWLRIFPFFLLRAHSLDYKLSCFKKLIKKQIQEANLRGYMLYHSNYIAFRKRQKYGDSKKIRVCYWLCICLCVEWKGMTRERMEDIDWSENSLYDILVMDIPHYSSVQSSHSVMSDSLRPHGLKHAGLLVHHHLRELTQTHVH